MNRPHWALETQRGLLGQNIVGARTVFGSLAWPRRDDDRTSRCFSWSRSRCHGTALVPRAAVQNRATSPAGPLIVSRLRSQSMCAGAKDVFQGPSGPWPNWAEPASAVSPGSQSQ